MTNTHAHTITLTYTDLDPLYSILVTQLKPHQLTACVVITKGGLIPAYHLCKALEIDVIDTLCLKSYHDTKPGPLHIFKRSSLFYTTNRLLIVDDVCDSGQTLEWIKQYPNKSECRIFVTLVCKDRKDLVNYYGMSIPNDTWVTLPWE